MAAGTAIYEALAAKMAKIKRSPTSSETKPLSMATTQPLNNGIRMAKISVNQPRFRNEPIFLPLVIPMSNKKIAKKPLKISFVKLKVMVKY